jgi:hypothetical protein
MANIDPLAPVIQALSVLVAPDPPLNRAGPQQPGTWTGGSNTATDGTLYTPAKALLGVLFGASADLTSLGNSINTGLTDVATVIASIAGQLGSLAAVEAQLTGPTGALTALQTVLGLAQMVAPSSTTGVLQSAEAFSSRFNPSSRPTAWLARLPRWGNCRNSSPPPPRSFPRPEKGTTRHAFTFAIASFDA